MFFFDRDLSLEEFRQRLGDRIAQAVDKAETKSKAADTAGVSVEQLNKWMKGTVKVPVDALRALSAFASVDFSWLITGEGESSPAQAGGRQVQGQGSVDNLDQPGMVSVPLYNEVRPSAGPGSTAISETPTTRVAFERHWLAEIGVQTDSAVILPAQGDSMEPTIMNGSPMLVDTSKTEVRSGFI